FHYQHTSPFPTRRSSDLNVHRHWFCIRSTDGPGFPRFATAGERDRRRGGHCWCPERGWSIGPCSLLSSFYCRQLLSLNVYMHDRSEEYTSELQSRENLVF